MVTADGYLRISADLATYGFGPRRGRYSATASWLLPLRGAAQLTCSNNGPKRQCRPRPRTAATDSHGIRTAVWDSFHGALRIAGAAKMLSAGSTNPTPARKFRRSDAPGHARPSSAEEALAVDTWWCGMEPMGVDIIVVFADSIGREANRHHPPGAPIRPADQIDERIYTRTTQWLMPRRVS